MYVRVTLFRSGSLVGAPQEENEEDACDCLHSTQRSKKGHKLDD